MNDREMLLRRLSGAQFAMWETHMFLDTHPHDENALKALNKYKEKYEKVLHEYEKKYGPIMSNNTFEQQTYTWIKDPWPWEREDN
jgi:spore coat protein JB